MVRGALRSQRPSYVRVPAAARNREAGGFPHCLPWPVPAFPPNLPRAQGPLVFLPGRGESTGGAGTPLGGIFLSPSPSALGTFFLPLPSGWMLSLLHGFCQLPVPEPATRG